MSYETFMYLASMALVGFGLVGLATTIYGYIYTGMYRGYAPVARAWVPRERLALKAATFPTLRGVHLGGCINGHDARTFGFGAWQEDAHAHTETGIICIYTATRGAAAEWLLAHEIAHLEAVGVGETLTHGRTWQAVLAALGYPEEAARYRAALDMHVAVRIPK